MKTTQSHLHKRNYYGEFTAERLVDWLNSHKSDTLETLLERNAGLPIQFTKHDVESYVARLVRKSKFAVAPAVEVSGGRWAVKWNPVGKMDFNQGLAFVKLLQLADQGLLDRVRRCARKECSLWFYARFHHQRFHDLACQQQTFRQDPDYKRKRADDQKRARHEARLRQRRQLEVAGGKR